MDVLTERGITIRRVATLADYDECVRIERETWGDQFTEYASSTILRISQEMGGVTAAAFDHSGRMLGFVFGITGVRNGELAHWSDMLAVRPEAQALGIGARLKDYQRELLLEIGVRTMYWTYDPLVSRNAHLNLVRLGARIVEYKVNYYGENTGSVVHAGLGTDRFIVAWDLTPSPDVSTTDQYARLTGVPVVNTVGADIDVPVIHTLPDARMIRVAIPGDIFAVLASDPALARSWRTTTRRAFSHYLGAGYQVVTFRRGAAGETGTYCLRSGDTMSGTHSPTHSPTAA